MSGCNERCGSAACGCIGVILSVIFGAFAGAMFALRYVPLAATGLWITLGLAVAALIALIAGAFLAAARPTPALQRCLCTNIVWLLVAIFGAIIFAAMTLVFEMLVSRIVAIIFFAITAFFFMLLIAELIRFIFCIICRLCHYPRENER